VTIEDEKEGIRARAVILEIRALISEAIDARLWAIRGVRNVLEQDQAAVRDDERKVRLAASAGRAIAQVNAMTIVAIYGGIEDLVETMGAGLHPIVVAANPDKRQAIFQHNRLRNIELKEAGELSKEGAQALTKFTKTLADALLPRPKRKPNPKLPSADGWEDLLKDIYMRPVPGRPLPDDLRLTLNELGAVRNVLLHRMGRMDGKALSVVSEGPWRAVNELVLIDDSLYRRYVAALIAYERDLEDRIRSQMGVGLQSDTTSWRTMVP
jgi:hypothetical protein